ncbi:hypothetical protein [Pontimicrobium aquaticum]|uniref:Lipocalin-like domain-containing protein n=1 Tax=Pontimicrobium aquaticum TaxID=2565367 RepID=A0A4U0EWX0_9FLAO|nr:hypothetical protein [Pontimicrobium aquaticum]TJY36433.1 hypothetical protein E5167_07160 [Pontimicrobium aquaticum]
MKKIYILIVLAILTQSCTVNDTDNFKNELLETWTLVNVLENSSNSQNNNNTLQVQEQLTLQNDSIFTRTRRANSNYWFLQGTYSIIKTDEAKYMVLKYHEESAIIGNCSNNKNEVLIFESENEISNIWFECGGPKLIYNKN